MGARSGSSRSAPNPLFALIVKEVKEFMPGAPRYSWHRLKRRHGGLGGGFDEFVPEIFGLHYTRAPRAYISDGGHYDNLGLLTALREEYDVIWCVDSEADKAGAAHQLSDVIQLAHDELEADIHLDPHAFTVTDGLLKASHAVSTVRYRPKDPADPGTAKTGTLIVIKLGLTDESSDDLKRYRQDRDHGFPAHGTFFHVAFGPERMEKYRELGLENAKAASAAYTAQRHRQRPRTDA